MQCILFMTTSSRRLICKIQEEPVLIRKMNNPMERQAICSRQKQDGKLIEKFLVIRQRSIKTTKKYFIPFRLMKIPTLMIAATGVDKEETFQSVIC